MPYNPKIEFDATHLHKAIDKHTTVANNKIVGVTCPDHDDANTWIVFFSGDATQQEIDEVNAYVATITDKDQVFVPQEVTKYQFKRALLAANQLDNVIAQVPNLTAEAKLYWEDNELIDRESTLLTELQSLMGLTDTQIDNFFRNASAIK